MGLGKAEDRNVDRKESQVTRQFRCFQDDGNRTGAKP